MIPLVWPIFIAHLAEQRDLLPDQRSALMYDPIFFRASQHATAVPRRSKMSSPFFTRKNFWFRLAVTRLAFNSLCSWRAPAFIWRYEPQHRLINSLQRLGPDRWVFQIRSGLLPNRSVPYYEELQHIFSLLLAQDSRTTNRTRCDPLVFASPISAFFRTAELLLGMAYYWYQLMPLHRGSAATGTTGTSHASSDF